MIIIIKKVTLSFHMIFLCFYTWSIQSYADHKKLKVEILHDMTSGNKRVDSMSNITNANNGQCPLLNVEINYIKVML